MRRIHQIILCFIIIFISSFINSKTYAANMQMSISKNSGYVDDTFTVVVSGIYGKVNITASSNISINISGSQFVDGSLTITGTAKSEGTGTVTVTPVDVVTTGADPEEVTAANSRSITINKKETQKPVQKPSAKPTPKPTPKQTTATVASPKVTPTATPEASPEVSPQATDIEEIISPSPETEKLETQEMKNDNNKNGMICMPIWSFILLQIIIIIAELFLFRLLNLKAKARKHRA